MPSLTDNNKTTDKDRAEVVIVGEDNDRQVDVIQRGDGKNAIAADTTVTVEEVLGQDPLPDTFFTITNAGAVDDTVRIEIAATANDSSSPDRDLPAVDVTYTLVAGDVGDEIELANNIVSTLNADSDFQNAELKADRVGGAFRAIVHITSKEFSLSGEFVERPNAGDFDVTATGTTTVNVGFDNLVSRGKPTSLARDPDNPHRLGILGISGSVVTTPQAIGSRYLEFFENGGSPDMLVDGSSTPVEFTIPLVADQDIFITQVRFYGGGNGIKFGQFLSKSGAGGLTNGITIEIKSDDEVIMLPEVKTTEDFKNKFAFQLTNAFKLDVQSGADQFISIFNPQVPFVLRAPGTFTSDDYIKIAINDDITAGVASLEALAAGFKKEA